MSTYDIPEKGQISVSGMTAFGISICSRHGKACEMAEMLNFSYSIAVRGLQKYIESVFYDSNSCSCTFSFIPLFDKYSEAAEVIRQCALETIRQFDWFGSYEHGVFPH